ncbi:MAG: hypothetical protein MUC62_04470, partial [Candidatus Thermoplasmatota archaeon]|nr:hypothetical protein [Candidatus Thermoplasmatota archaeon]
MSEPDLTGPPPGRGMERLGSRPPPSGNETMKEAASWLPFFNVVEDRSWARPDMGLIRTKERNARM